MSVSVLAPFTPRPWQNQAITLYHGTDDQSAMSITQGINLNRAASHSDFGAGFYTTTRLRQAWSWAYRTAYRTNLKAAVVRFVVDRDELSNLQSLVFVLGSPQDEDYWSLVTHCRRRGGNHGRATPGKVYDVVYGPVAANWRQGTLLGDTDQVSFHTPQALQLLDKSSPRYGVAP